MDDLASGDYKFTLEFIKMYKSFPCLWNVHLHDYNDRYKRAQAYKKLTELMRRVNLRADLSLVRRKICSLRATWRKERRKVLALREENSAYRSSWKFYKDMIFLTKIENSVKEVENETGEENLMEENENPLEEDYENFDIEFVQLADADVISDSLEEEKHNLAMELNAQNENKDKKSNGNISKPKTKSMVYVSFGKYIASELSTMDHVMAMHCRKIINDAIFLGQMKRLSCNSRLVTQ